VVRLLICQLLVLLSIDQSLRADSSDISLQQVSRRTWVHTSYEVIAGFNTDANGMVVDCKSGVVLVDACWNDIQAATLLEMIKERFNKPVLLAIITHSHIDRVGGIRTLLRNGIKVVSTPLTAQLAGKAGYPEPFPELDPNDTNLRIGDSTIEVFFPGPGHTKDNIIVWVPADQVLFGGCLVKSKESMNLGNVADADVPNWANSIGNLVKRFPKIRVVIPGHGQWGNIDLLQHTIALCPGM
jgi:metallo-beta-lactamase class B